MWLVGGYVVYFGHELVKVILVSPTGSIDPVGVNKLSELKSINLWQKVVLDRA